MYTAIFVSLFLVAWLALAFIPWLAVSVRTRGHAGLLNLPLCLLAGVAGGFAVPLLGLTGSEGVWISMAVAFVAPAVLLAARRFSLGAPVQGTSVPGGARRE